MKRLRGWLLGFSIAVAAWLSDRWLWTLPGLLGVSLGVWLSHVHHEDAVAARDVPAFALSSLLIIVSFVYLYVLFLILQLRRAFELLELEHTPTPPTVAFLAGFLFLSLLLLGLGALLCFKLNIPRWVSRAWEKLLEQR